MNLMRCTVVDAYGAVSFIVDGDAIPALVAACTHNPRTLAELLELADPLYGELKDRVLNGLAMFDEQNVPGNYKAIHAAFDVCAPHQQPVFRVVDDRTREESLRPVKAGALIFNLPDKRIVQLQNSYRAIARSGRYRVFDGSRHINRVFSYRLPVEWAIVP
ncbi:MAG TPA: hypothetical protein VFA70_01280 [Dehalococcoidia bacterium]|jgi:hypothetical protein|nr:hypothetical protein [Dehalococcoidia bacterium]